MADTKAPIETKVEAPEKSMEEKWSEMYPCPLGLCTKGICDHVMAAHPAAQICPDKYCGICSMRDCPFQSAMHYHKTGCPYCDERFVGGREVLAVPHSVFRPLRS